MVLRHSVYSYLGTIAAIVWLACFALPSDAETVLLDFSSPGCGPCQQMRPTIGRLVAAGYKVQHVDISRDPQTASHFGVSRFPTFIVLVDNRVVARTEGIIGYDKLTEMMASSGPQPHRQLPPPPPRQTPSTFATPLATNNPNAQVANSQAAIPQGQLAQPGPVVPLPSQPNSPQQVNNSTRNPSAGQTPRQSIQPPGSANFESRLIEATVKVAVKDPDGVSSGTGTVVDARSGEALILTCGHLFRSSNGQGPITVTMYQAGPTGVEVRTTATGYLVDFDLKRDLALVRFRPEVSIRPIPIAQPGTALIPGAAVTSVGCNNGQNPTVMNTQITAVDRYQGPPNVEAAGAPVEGRSGGGLFNAQGQLVGVCFAADPQGNEGLYASLPSVQAKLDSLGLAIVYQSPAATINLNADLNANNSPTSHLAQQTPAISQAATSSAADFTFRGQEPSLAPHPPSDMPFAEAVRPIPLPETLNPIEKATLEEIQRRAVDSEVIIIIRPRSPDGKSEVITLHSASSEFVKTLTASAAPQRSAPTASNGIQRLR